MTNSFSEKTPDVRNQAEGFAMKSTSVEVGLALPADGVRPCAQSVIYHGAAWVASGMNWASVSR
jgi:hypothetical protein